MKDQVKEFINSLQSSLMNNSRAIVKHIYRKSLRERYGGYYSNLLEEMTGEPSDRTGYDCGMEPEYKNLDY